MYKNKILKDKNYFWNSRSFKFYHTWFSAEFPSSHDKRKYEFQIEICRPLSYFFIIHAILQDLFMSSGFSVIFFSICPALFIKKIHNISQRFDLLVMFFKTFLNVSIIKKVTTISKVCMSVCQWVKNNN